MQQNTENLIFLAVGPLAAILLGMALVPFRSDTSASNLTFLFLILTILITEYGGRRAAFATALCSALSLDFFLTQPYLQLGIKSMHDVIAFAGLALCGLLVATFASQRGENVTELTSAREQLNLLRAAISSAATSRPGNATELESQLWKLLDAVRCAPLAAAAVRDENNSVVAAFAHDSATPVPVQVLSPQTLLLRGSAVDNPQNLPFPNEGARVPLVFGSRQLGWLDLWGNGAPAGREMRRALSDVALLLALQLEIRQAAEPLPH
jgi:K+-sensing histidine kinase KdpD